MFLNEISRYLDELNTADSQLLIVEDFNFNMDDYEKDSLVEKNLGPLEQQNLVY